MAASPDLDPRTLSYVRKAFPNASTSETDPTKLSSSLYTTTTYDPADTFSIVQWINFIPTSFADFSTLNSHLSTRTTLLGSKPSVADIDLYTRLAPRISAWRPDERTGEHGYHHIVRWADFVQSSPLFGLKLEEGEKIKIDQDEVLVKIKPIDAKAEKERRKKEKEATGETGEAESAAGEGKQGGSRKAKKAAKEAAKEVEKKVDGAVSSTAAAVGIGGGAGAAGAEAGGKKKEKPKKPQPPPKEEKPLSPSLIDLRVGHILKAERHPNADSLYVSTIAMGDPAGTDNTSEHEGQIVRTVCSGLNGLIPLEEMQGRKIVAVANLKPVTMRGIKSCAMVLAASPREAPGEDAHKGPVELVDPPGKAVAGERVYFEGWQGEPEPQLNPKKKVWETIQPGFTTTAGGDVGFEVGDVPQLAGEGEGKRTGVGILRTKEGVCKVKTLTGATVR
ncbi:MAG: G4 quadruplex nucleic acid binding protein [Bogoriella megaspora]|nr:MAG: G4 quadruplex nucleic acid binding protein [Bogoriella megaspora]